MDKKIIALLVMVLLLGSLCFNAFAATVGQPLTSPEAGWQRIEQDNSRVHLIGDYWALNFPDVNTSGGSKSFILPGTSAANVNTCKVKFKFYGTKIRFINSRHEEHTTNLRYKIDGIEVGSANVRGTLLFGYLAFEKTGLPAKVHDVEIYSGDGVRFEIDAIDIDDIGYMADYYQPANLTATSGNAAVILSWDAVENAARYNIKKSTTAGGPYTTIATDVTGITYTDADATNGTTYYYVVSTVTASGESEPSNEVSATPTRGNSAILEITMTTGTIKEYNVTAIELQDFLSWYDGSSSGAYKTYYIFAKKNNIAPFLSRKEYLAFDKIVSFEIKEYEE